MRFLCPACDTETSLRQEAPLRCGAEVECGECDDTFQVHLEPPGTNDEEEVFTPGGGPNAPEKRLANELSREEVDRMRIKGEEDWQRDA